MATKKAYPFSDIRVVTNGILLPILDDSVWKVMKENDIGFNLSAYPAMYGKMDEYINLIKMHDIRFAVWHVSCFLPTLHEEREISFDNTKDCFCLNLHDGMISSCAMTFYGKYFNEYFGKNIPFETGNIDLYDKELTGTELVKKLNEPFELCKFCNNHMSPNSSDNSGWDLYKNGEDKLESDWY